MKVGDFVRLRNRNEKGFIVGEYTSGLVVDVLWLSGKTVDHWGRVGMCDVVLLEVEDRCSQ